MTRYAHMPSGSVAAIYDRNMQQTEIAGHVVKGKYLANFTPEQLLALSLVKIERAVQPVYDPATERLELVLCTVGAAEALDTWNIVALTAEEIATLEAIAAEEQRIADLKADTLRQDMIDRLTSASPQQISDYVDNNVTDLASARTMFKRILLILAVAVKE